MRILDNMLEVEDFRLLDTPYATFVMCHYKGSLKNSINDGRGENLGRWERVFAEDSFREGCLLVYRRSHDLNAGPCSP